MDAMPSKPDPPLPVPRFGVDSPKAHDRQQYSSHEVANDLKKDFCNDFSWHAAYFIVVTSSR
jgi:hypothetical protein